MIRDVHPRSGIRILDPDLDFLPIPDPGVNKAPDPDSQHWYHILQVCWWQSESRGCWAGLIRRTEGSGTMRRSRLQTKAGEGVDSGAAAALASVLWTTVWRDSSYFILMGAVTTQTRQLHCTLFLLFFFIYELLPKRKIDRAFFPCTTCANVGL